MDNQTYVEKCPTYIKVGHEGHFRIFFILTGCFFLSKVLEGTACYMDLFITPVEGFVQELFAL